MINKLNIAILFISWAMICGCSSGSYTEKDKLVLRSIGVNGEINEDSLRSLQKQISEKRAKGYKGKFRLIIFSNGGDTRIMLDMLKLIREEVDIVIANGHCLSACAELIVASNLPVRFSENTVIGFQNGPTFDQTLVELENLNGNFSCIKKVADQYREFAQFDTQEADLKKIQYLDYKSAKALKDNGKCTKVEYTAGKLFWFPSSEQLKDIYGLEYTGPSPCSDDEACLDQKVSKWWGPGIAYTFGEKAKFHHKVIS